ncbi:hypothetical protein IMCC12053_1970 [Celeribacter marinus]|uniref:Uncharacterized protein n=1 Tax=Celeribacter marinus TaxID=1397108 RepID=A0A0N7HIR0_9RHOB|nr:hypothetical protein IMCC12053_1970 [Celeribacter marinus]
MSIGISFHVKRPAFDDARYGAPQVGTLIYKWEALTQSQGLQAQIQNN